MWKSNDIIRNRLTGKPMLVVHVYRNCTLIIDIENSQVNILNVIIEKDYENWSPDTDMINSSPEYDGDWKYEHVNI